MTNMLGTGVEGYVAPGFGPVREAFARNFTEYDELGAAFAAYREDIPLVDIWAGAASAISERPWTWNTLAPIFSGTKALVATCLLLLIDRDVLDLDRPVATYWPEFAHGDKADLLVRQLVSHTARLPGVDTPITESDVINGTRIVAQLARQAPSRDPRAGMCYHALTFGWLCGELVKRIDGRTVGTFFAEEVARPLGLDTWIGLPASEQDRVAELSAHPTWPQEPVMTTTSEPCGDSLVHSIWHNPPLFAHPEGFWNRHEVQQAEIPGAGGVTTARSMAYMFASLPRIVSETTLKTARTRLSQGWDEIHATERRFGVGFALPDDSTPYGPSPDAYGHRGAGGSLHGSWPHSGIGFSYTMNLMRDDRPTDPRAKALLDALWQAESLSQSHAATL
jgi:CubicO group peptidase (beta-lactamase class C family)